MARATDAQRAERLNRARDLLRRSEDVPTSVKRLARECAISPRQAYRYVQQAERLTGRVAVDDSKMAFTVKLPATLILRVRSYAAAKRLSISEVVKRALVGFFQRGRE